MHQWGPFPSTQSPPRPHTSPHTSLISRVLGKHLPAAIAHAHQRSRRLLNVNGSGGANSPLGAKQIHALQAFTWKLANSDENNYIAWVFTTCCCYRRPWRCLITGVNGQHTWEEVEVLRVDQGALTINAGFSRGRTSKLTSKCVRKKTQRWQSC